MKPKSSSDGSLELLFSNVYYFTYANKFGDPFWGHFLVASVKSMPDFQ